MSPAVTASGIAMMGGWSATATPTTTAPRAPMRNWPPAPMLKRPALKPRATDSPASTRGTVSSSVLTMALRLPTDPLMSAA